MRRKRATRKTFAVLAGASLLAAPVAAACSDGPAYEDWAATDGAAGRINLDEVQQAFKSSESPTQFEERVNEIYEGDGIVLVRVEQDGQRMTLEGWEDLNRSREIEAANDDRLFSIVKENERHEMRGYGANGYYHNSFGAGNFLFTYLLLSTFSPFGGRYHYYTTPARYDNISRNRTNYRNSSGYRGQVSKNTQYFSKQKSFAGSNYAQAGKNVGTSRQTYLNSQKSTGAFKSSGTGVRSSWGGSGRSSSLGRSSGGFTGGGGSLRLTNLGRSTRA